MRELYIGGVAQGKLEYVRRIKSEEKAELKVIDCADWQAQADEEDLKALLQGENGEPVNGSFSEGEKAILVFHHFHQWVRNMVFAGIDAEQEFARFLEQFPEWIIISDEVGNGIVPMEKAEREYRECLGRILIEAAKRADRVERVMCGLGQRIK